MNLKKIIKISFVIIFLYSCADYQATTKDEKKYYSSKGFALIYNENLYKDKQISKKINNEKMQIIHSTLKINTPVRLINPDNQKFINANIYKKGSYPKIFSVVISEKIASNLELDLDNPYVELIEVKKNKTFIAKKANTFDEEKNVAQSAPVDEITMQVLSSNDTEVKNIKNKYSYFLIIGDFYYHESALNLKDELLKKVKSDKFFIKKITENSHRLGLGPFKNFKALKSTYISLNNLGFDNLDIYKE